MFEREIRSLSDVPRWSTLRTIQKQNVAEHSFYVMFYARQIVEFLELTDWLLQVLVYAMWHDAEEQFTGDGPGPWKRLAIDVDRSEVAARRLLSERHPDWPEGPVHDTVKAIVKMANLIDELMFLANDFQMGNRNVVGVMNNTMERVELMVNDMPCNEIQKTNLLQAIKRAHQKHMYHLSDYLTG